MKLPALTAAVLTVALATACGSTVPPTQQASVGNGGLGSSRTGSTIGATTTSGGTTGTTSTSGTSTGSIPTGSSGTSGGTAGGTSGTSPSTSGTGTGGATGAGSTSGTKTSTSGGPVEVGYFVTKDAGAALAALGYSGLSTGDGSDEAKVAVSVVNSHGGLAGRSIKAVIYEADPTNLSDATFQAACAAFFDDNKVSAVVSITQSPVLSSCAAAHHVGLIAAGSGSESQSSLSRNPAVLLSSVMTLDDVAGQLTDALVRTRFFTATSGNPLKIGLVHLDSAEYNAVESIVRAHLSRAGLTLTDAVAMPNDDAASASTAGKSAALKFAADGITHVLTVDNNGFGISWFAIGAQSNNYYPRYGLSTLDNLAAIGSSSSAKTLAGAQGIGWSPAIDQPRGSQQDLGDHSASCTTAMSKAGIDMSSGTTHQFALGLCDATFLLQAVLRSGSFTASGFIAGAAALGTTFPSAMVFTSSFGKSHAAARGYRSVAYNAACTCFPYSSGITSF